jgi:D-alanine-D-alanine ligase-like ATP-grasp enzyme
MQPCLYCGNNPINHPTHKFYGSVDIMLTPLRQKIMRGWFGQFTDTLGTWIALELFHLLKPIGLIKINRDISQVPFERAKTLWAEANARNIPFEEIKPFNQSIDLYRATIRGQPIYFMNMPRKEDVITSNLSWIDDKHLLKQKLLEHNFPVASGGSFTNLADALKTFETLDKPVIVKPRAGSRGRHTTTLVNNEEELRKAFKIAKQLCHWVIVEEHLFGDVQRATIIGNQLIGVLGGSPPRVKGDGVHTIAELIKLKDAARPQKVKEIKINEYYLQRSAMNLGTILAKDQTADLSEKIGVNYGGTSYDCTDETHPETKQMLEDAAKILDISILGFDFIIPDITKSYREQKSGIIECNGAPFLQLHHEPLYGKSINAAKYVWDLIV